MVSTASDRDRFICEHLPLAVKLARRVSVKVPLADPQEILADAKASLCRAHDVFDPAKNVSFEAFASVWVRGEIFHGLRSRNQISERVNATVRRSQAAWSSFATQHGRVPTQAELESLVPGTNVALWEAHRRSSLSIDASFADPPSVTSAPDSAVIAYETAEAVRAAVNSLEGRHREVVLLAHYGEYTREQIAVKWHTSPQFVTKMLRQSHAMLWFALRDEALA